MELRQLIAFIKTAETLNFSQAARELFISQSALSQSLKKLEESLGVPLFSRDSHGVSLTEAGEALLPLANKTVEASRDCKERISDLGTMKSGLLRIGITHSFRPLSSEALLQFIKEYPGIHLEIVYKTGEELMGMLQSRQLDMVLSYKNSETLRDIESRVLFTDRLCAIVSNIHPLSKKDTVSLEDVLNYPLVLHSKGAFSRDMLGRMALEKGIALNPRIVINEVTPQLALIAHGDVVGVLSGRACRTNEGTRAIPIVGNGNLQMKGCIHIYKGSYMKKSARAFLQILCDSNDLSLKIESLFE